MDTKPLISVIIPAWNAADFLADALERILSQPQLPKMEVLVIDNASTDNTGTIAMKYAPTVRTLRIEPNRGPGGARNHGIQHSNGELLAFCDADDLWMSDKLTKQLAMIQQHSNVDGVLGYAEQFVDSQQLNTIELPEQSIMPAYLFSALLIRRTALQKVGLQITDTTLGDTVDWFARAKDAGLHLEMLSDVVFRRRLHPNNLGRTEAAARLDYVRVLREKIHRQRAAQAGEPNRDGLA